MKNEFYNKTFALLSLLLLILSHSTISLGQCDEKNEANIAKYKLLSKSQDTEGCSKCAKLALYLCSAKYSVKLEDIRKVSSLITSSKTDILNSGKPYCCPELVNKDPEWGIMIEQTDALPGTSNTSPNSQPKVNQSSLQTAALQPPRQDEMLKFVEQLKLYSSSPELNSTLDKIALQMKMTSNEGTFVDQFSLLLKQQIQLNPTAFGSLNDQNIEALSEIGNTIVELINEVKKVKQYRESVKYNSLANSKSTYKKHLYTNFDNDQQIILSSNNGLNKEVIVKDKRINAIGELPSKLVATTGVKDGVYYLTNSTMKLGDAGTIGITYQDFITKKAGFDFSKDFSLKLNIRIDSSYKYHSLNFKILGHIPCAIWMYYNKKKKIYRIGQFGYVNSKPLPDGTYDPKHFRNTEYTIDGLTSTFLIEIRKDNDKLKFFVNGYEGSIVWDINYVTVPDEMYFNGYGIVKIETLSLEHL